MFEKNYGELQYLNSHFHYEGYYLRVLPNSYVIVCVCACVFIPNTKHK